MKMNVNWDVKKPNADKQIKVRMEFPSPNSRRTMTKVVVRVGREMTSHVDPMGVFTEEGIVTINGKPEFVRRTESLGSFAVVK